MKKYEDMPKRELIALLKTREAGQDAEPGGGGSPEESGNLLHVMQGSAERSQGICLDFYDFAPIGFVMFDTRGVIREINLTGAEMIGRDRSLLLNTPFISHIIKSDRKKFLCHLEKCKQSDGKVLSAICMSMERGNFLHLQLHSIAATNSPVDSTLFLTALVDMSEVVEIKSLAEQLTRSEENLRRSIATELSENILGFLAVAQTRIDGLSGTLESAHQLAAIDMIRESLETANNRIESLARQICIPEIYETNLESALCSLVKMVREEQKITAEFHCDVESFPIDEATQMTILQAAREFLGNAARHAQAKKIVITLTTKKGNIVVKIEDNGTGFDHDQLIRSRGNEAHFGLLNAKRRIEHIGGVVQIDDAPGRGTCVTMTAPIKGQMI